MATSVSLQIAAIKKSAKKMHAAAPATIGSASAGDVVRQGDVMLVAIDTMPPGVVTKNRQLAEGATQGSRHIAEGDCDIVMPSDKTAVVMDLNRLVPSTVNRLVPQRDEALIGPALRCNGPVTITHPEHGWRTLEAGSLWVCVFQREFSEENRPVQD